MAEIDNETYSRIKRKIDAFLEPVGCECHPFKIGWYNEHVKQPFQLQLEEDTLAFVVFSLPSMFEKTFIPYLKENTFPTLRDPIDQCMINIFSKLQNELSEFDCQTIHDFDILPSRRPQILAQTAAHVSGAAYYYQRSDVKSEPWSPTQRIYGVCIHPAYGGWFAIRGILILSRICYPELPRKQPKQVLKSQQEIVKLLEDFNYSWQDYGYRDTIPPIEKYSEKQKLYFSTLPADRHSIISKILDDS